MKKAFVIGIAIFGLAIGTLGARAELSGRIDEGARGGQLVDDGIRGGQLSEDNGARGGQKTEDDGARGGNGLHRGDRVSPA